MLAQKELVEWFRNNGIDIGIPFPVPLIDKLCRKALSKDTALFAFLNKSFRSHKKNYLILNFNNWDEVFVCYTLTGDSFSLKV